MIRDKWTELFTQFGTRTEVRGVLSRTLAGIMEPATDSTTFPREIRGLCTSNDREVMESYLRVKIFCETKRGKIRGSGAGGVANDVRDLLAMAIERLKQLPPEPVTLAAVASVRSVRRA